MYVITWSNMCSMWIGIFLITTSIIYNYGKKKLVKIFRNIVNKSIMFWFPKKSVSSIFKYYVIVSAIAKLSHSRCLENNFFMEIIQIVRAKLYTTFETYIYVSILKCSISLKRPHYEIKSTNLISSIMISILCFDPWNYKKQPPTPKVEW